MKLLKSILAVFMAVCMTTSFVPTSVKAEDTTGENTSVEYKIVHLDNGRKYFSVSSVKKIIDNAASAGFNYVELAVGNDGMRFLLDDMSLTVNDKSYTSEAVKEAVHSGNETYSDFEVDELTQSEMDEIIAYANAKNISIIPLINTPGHMDAILSAMTTLGVKNASYNGSVRTIDVTNAEAVAFTKAFLQKYINYFAGKGCKLFNMGADEYANDVYKNGDMGFGNLQSTGRYSYFINYLNELAAMVKEAGMKPMAFNDGIYYNDVTNQGTVDTDILVSHWSNGWGRESGGYRPATLDVLSAKGFKLLNTNGYYYWVLGKSDYQCDAERASKFNVNEFDGGTVANPVGAMFCIWTDYPQAGTEQFVVNSTAATIAAFGKTLAGNNAASEDNTLVTVTDNNNNVSVTAEGLVSVTATETNAPEALSAKNVVAYDVTPVAGGVKYTESATVTMPIPEGWEKAEVRAFVVNSDSTITTAIEGTVNGNTFSFTAPHFSTMGIYELQNAEDLKEETINLTVGSNQTVTVPNVDYSNAVNKSDLNEGIATVSANYQNVEGKTEYTKVSSITSGSEYLISDGNGNFLTVSGNNVTNTTDVTKATQWRVLSNRYNSNQYVFSVNDSYIYSDDYGNLSLSNNSYTFFGYNSNGMYEINYTDYFISFANGVWSSTTSGSKAHAYTADIVTPVNQTTITFTGVSEGTTYVTVGDTRYTIVVEEAAPSNALTGSNLTIEYWITNARVTGEQSNKQNLIISRSNAETTEGVEINGVVDETGSYTWAPEGVNYWKAVRLDSTHTQTGDANVDRTADGEVFTHVRFHGAWQYKTSAGVWKYFTSSDQLVAYYLQKQKVTAEIDTYFKDWGLKVGNEEGSNQQVALTVAVVYPDGTVSPVESNMYSKSTLIFNYWDKDRSASGKSGRNIGTIVPKNDSDYRFSKITITEGTRKYGSGSSSNSIWNTNDNITWEKVKNDAGTTWYDETEVWNKSSGTEPMVHGNSDIYFWTAKNTAKLILIYLEPIEKSTNLNVRYVDDSDNSVINSYQIAMTYNQGQAEPKFYDKLVQNSSVPSSDSEFELDDDAYVKNSSGTQQTFNKDLSIIAGIDGKYLSGLYKYIKAELADDGKTLILHFDIDSSKLQKSFVVDFGLPLNITLSDLDIEASKVEKVEVAGGNASVNSDKSITYIPAEVLKGTDSISIRVYFTNSSSYQIFRVGILPATTVYYEEGFAKYGTTWNVTGSGDWNGTTNKGTVTQETNHADKKDEVNYNYTSAYADNTTASNGTAASTSTRGDALTFTFTGTGVDLFATGSADSGKVLVRVQNASGTTEKMIAVNTTLNGSYGELVTSGTSYNTPITTINNLDYGTHKVTVYVSDKSFVFDGFRVYNTMGNDKTAEEAYKKDLEEKPVYYELRDLALVGNTNTDGEVNQVFKKYGNEDKTVAVVTGGPATNDGYADLLVNGPKNELYLTKDMSVKFKLNTDRTVQIGLRSVTGAQVSYTVNGDSKEINSSVDMYYDLQAGGARAEKEYTITNTSDGLLSITTIKVSDDPNALVVLSDEDIAEMISDSSEEPVVEPEPTVDPEPVEDPTPVVTTFEPETFNVALNKSSVKVGEKATLTVKASEDVESVVVDGEEISDYRTETEYTYSGWLWNRTRVAHTYRVFTKTLNTDTVGEFTYTVTAKNAEGADSEAKTVTLSVFKNKFFWFYY